MSYKIFSAGQLHELSASSAEVKLFRAASERYWANLITKAHPTAATSEMHDQEADIYLVLEGEGELYLGGTLIDATSPRPGQHRGSGLHGATAHHISAGDLIIIPEGTPHMVDARGQHLVYLVIKQDVGVE